MTAADGPCDYWWDGAEWHPLPDGEEPPPLAARIYGGDLQRLPPPLLAGAASAWLLWPGTSDYEAEYSTGALAYAARLVMAQWNRTTGTDVPPDPVEAATEPPSRQSGHAEPEDGA